MEEVLAIPFTTSYFLQMVKRCKMLLIGKKKNMYAKKHNGLTKGPH